MLVLFDLPTFFFFFFKIETTVLVKALAPLRVPSLPLYHFVWLGLPAVLFFLYDLKILELDLKCNIFSLLSHIEAIFSSLFCEFLHLSSQNLAFRHGPPAVRLLGKHAERGAVWVHVAIGDGWLCRYPGLLGC